MNIIYPINGKNERMGKLFQTPKHLLLYKGKPLLLASIETMRSKYKDAHIIIITNDYYCDDIQKALKSIKDITIKIIGKTSSQIETINTATKELEGPVMFVDCDILPLYLGNFDESYPTVFTFINNTNLLNYSNYKSGLDRTIIDCNEKEQIYNHAGAGIYYFPDVSLFNKLSIACTNVSQCIKNFIKETITCKVHPDNTINRYGTLQDIYIDNISFRNPLISDLSTGFTDNIVIKLDEDTIQKTGKTVEDEYLWYHSYKNKKHIPRDISIKDNTLRMEYIQRDADINLDDIFDIIYEYKSYDKLNNLKFDAYISNIQNHLNNNPAIPNGHILMSNLSQLIIDPTFCHGDLSIMNIIPTMRGIKLIDPLYSISKFGSYEIDIAKLAFSTKFYKNDSASFNYIKSKATGLYYVDILIAAESVRVSSYKKEYSFISENLINELNNEY